MFVEKIEDKKIKITVSGIFAKGVPNNEHNTLYKMAKAFFTHHGFLFGVHIHLIKNIPHQSGLGGASSNAAGILKALEYFFFSESQPVPQKILPTSFFSFAVGLHTPLSLIQSVGNDIPFFLGEFPRSQVSGFGEILSASCLPPPPSFGILLFNPRIVVNTAWAYQQFSNRSFPVLQNNIEYTNDFEPLIFSYFPDLYEWKNLLVECGAREAGLTGSGSAIFGMFGEEKDRQKAKKYFPEGICFEII